MSIKIWSKQIICDEKIVEETQEMVDFVNTLNHRISGNQAKSINVCIGILPWGYFDQPFESIHCSKLSPMGPIGSQGSTGVVGCCGYKGLMGPLISGQKFIGKHDEKLATLMIIIHNHNHEEYWTHLTEESLFLNLINELKNNITSSSNSYATRALNVHTLTH